MKLAIAFLGLFLLSQSTVQAQEIYAKTYSSADCASGGMEYYFFRDFSYIGRCFGCESAPYVEYGFWEQDGTEITLTSQTIYEGQPEGDPIPPCGSVCQYESYKAVKRKEKQTETITFSYEQDGCETWTDGAPAWLADHYSVHQALRHVDARRDYPQASTRELSKSELTGMSKSELRLMRNEIFASYGYKFKSKDLQEHFRKRNMYGFMSNVTAFLSETELKNIDLIREVEASK